MHPLTRYLKDRLTTPPAPAGFETHLRAAAEWLLRAQAATPDDGLAHSYDLRARRWLASYPETTGYAIATLLDYAQLYDAPEASVAALKMADWECAIQLEGGGVRAGTMDAEIVAPTIFNTGQVLFGWARALQATDKPAYREALVHAADWLVAAQDEDGAWRRFASPFTTAKLNSYNTRTAFGLVRAYAQVADPRYLAAARANALWAISRAAENGWLPDNCLTINPGGVALTHTLAYSIRGLLEVGVACATPQLIEHALTMARALAAVQRDDGALPGYISPAWQPAARFSCVTGNSQMAINWLRLAQLTQEPGFFEAAQRANRFNMSIQDLRTDDAHLRGALKGSHPIDGDYMSWRYPNWATKFFMDGLMLEQHFERIQVIG